MTVETLDEILKQKDVTALKSLMEKENLYIKDGKIFAKDVKDAIKKSTYWDMIQLVRKIGLNSIYGAVTNQGSIFFDQRLGQQCTLTGRCTTRHMGSAINECLYDVYELGESTIYGDSVSGDSLIQTNIGELPISELHDILNVKKQINGKEYSYPTNQDIQVVGYDIDTGTAIWSDINFVMKHNTSKERWKIVAETGEEVYVTSDHSIAVIRDNEFMKIMPSELKDGDMLVKLGVSNHTKLVKIVKVEKVSPFENEDVYDLSIKDNDTVFFANNILVSNTDSIYFQIPHELKTTMDKESFIAIADKAGNYANNSFPEFYKNTFNVDPEGSSVIKCSREICAEAALFIKKKRYTALVYDEKHFRYDVDGKVGKLKIMGLDIKRADCPKWVQVKLEETIKTLLADKKSEDEILDFIRGWRNDFIKFSPWKKGIPKRVNKLTYYTEVYNSGRKGITVPGHARASINWNIMKKINNDMDSMTIMDGGKVIVCKLKKNKFNIDSIAYPIDQHNLPKWFLSLPFDDDEMIQVAVDQKLENIFGLLQWDLDSVKITGDTLDLFSLE